MALNGVFSISPALGIDFESTQLVNDGTEVGNYPVGGVVFDNFGGQWLRVRAAENITINRLCHVTNASVAAGTWLAELSEAADLATGPKFLGVSQVAIASGSYGWLWRGPGGGYGRGIKIVSENMTAGALACPLSGNPGAIDDANVDEGVIAGLTTITTTTTATAVECMATTIITCNLTEVD